MNDVLRHALYAGLLVLALRCTAWFAVLAAAWLRFVRETGAADDAESEKIIAAQMTVPITFVLAPGADEKAGTFLARTGAALAIRYPGFEVIAVLPASRADLAEQCVREFDLKKINMVFRKVFSTPPVLGIHKTPAHKNLLVLQIDGVRRGDLLNAAVNLSTYPLICVIQGTPTPDSVTSLMVPFVRSPRECAGTVGAIAPDAGDRRSGMFWLDNAGRLLGAAAAPSIQLRKGLPEVSLLLRKDAIIAAGGFAATGRYEGLLLRIARAGKRPSLVATVARIVGTSTMHGLGGWAAKEWALGRNVRQRLGAAAAAFSVVPPVLELGAWCAAAAAVARGAAGAGEMLFFLALAVGAAFVFRTLALFCEETSFGVHRRAGKLPAVIAACIVENFGPRQAILAVRAASRLSGLLRKRMGSDTVT
ncbi:MAG: hypothetical protein HY897_16895 [Deltaproteobacteria bacterium]|nr:hypothetical protein [Deltaproteobacteria bacterium]